MTIAQPHVFTRIRPFLTSAARTLGIMLALLTCLSLSPSVFAQTSLESIELKHRPAQLLIDKLAGQLLPGETAVAAGAAMLVTADTARMAVIRQLVQTMDQPLMMALIEARLGPLNQLQRDDAFEGNVTVTSRGNAGVLVIGGASDGVRLLSQSLLAIEATKASLSLGNAKPLVLKTQLGLELASAATSNSNIGASATRLGAQSGLSLAWYAVNKQEVLIELAPRTTPYSQISQDAVDQVMPLRMTALLPIVIRQWVTVAQEDNDKQSPDQGYVLQLKITPQASP